jgi:hypothetical protein
LNASTSRQPSFELRARLAPRAQTTGLRAGRWALVAGLALLASCAEKRQPPRAEGPGGAEPASPSSAEAGSAGPPGSAPGLPKVPASFASSKAAKGFLTPTGAPAAQDAVSRIFVLDLDGDGSAEVILVPGARFCGTGGCAPATIYDERSGDWVGIGELPQQWNEIEEISLRPAGPPGGFSELEVRRRSPKAPLLARYDGARYKLELPPAAADLLPEKQVGSLLFLASRYDAARGAATLGLWDKLGANRGAAAEVRVSTPGGETFSLPLGGLGDDWRQADFPADFAGAPGALPPGRYKVEYLVEGKRVPEEYFEAAFEVK